MIKEWDLLRTIACICIVLLHSTTHISLVVGLNDHELYNLLRVVLCFATPTFLVLSVIIIANRYPKQLPKDFWIKRFKWIYVPFLFFAIIDALRFKHIYHEVNFQTKLVENVLQGSWVGWFVIVIFQFYLLYYIFLHFKVSMIILTPISLILMAVYLFLINNGISFFSDNIEYHKLIFLTWFGYFTIAVLVGRYYHVIAPKLWKYRWYTFIGVIASIIIIYVAIASGITGVYSTRMDIFLLVITISTSVLAWGQIIPRSKIVSLISNYSFGIYLVHWQIQSYLAPYISHFIGNTFFRVLVLFFITIVFSITIIKGISYLPYGAYIVGKVNRSLPNIKQNNQKKIG